MADFPSSLSGEEFLLFSERIARSLRERPLDLEPTAHRERLAELLRELGVANFYQWLGVEPASSERTIQESYERLARLVHPLHAAQIGLEGKGGVFEILFERTTLAYLTLSDPDRRRRYDRQLGPEALDDSTVRMRPEDPRERARHYFEKASVLASHKEYHFAVELLREAARIHPQAEYFALLGRLQAKNSNPRWLSHAAESLQQAIRLGSKDPDLPAALEEVKQRLAAPPAESEGEAEEASVARGKRR